MSFQSSLRFTLLGSTGGHLALCKSLLLYLGRNYQLPLTNALEEPLKKVERGFS